jgi:hypothetical protein
MANQDELLARIEALESRLQAVDDLQAIHRLKARYAHLVDARTPHRKPRSQAEIDTAARQVAALFSEDGIWDGGKALGIARGREEIYERLRHPTVRFAWHFFVKPHIEVEGDTAHGTWDILSPCTSAEGRAMWMAGVEHDTYARCDGEWLHTSMRLEVVFMTPYERGWGTAPEAG